MSLPSDLGSIAATFVQGVRAVAVFSRNQRGRFPCAPVVAVPAGLIDAPDRVIVQGLLSRPDFLFVWSRVFEAPAARQIGLLTREISLQTKVLAWGDGPLFMPQYYGREPFDGAVTSGDAELVLADAIERLAGGGLPEHDMLVKADGRWIETARGHWPDPAIWPFPDPDVIAFDDYQRGARELRGKPTDGLSFDVSRGCVDLHDLAPATDSTMGPAHVPDLKNKAHPIT